MLSKSSEKNSVKVIATVLLLFITAASITYFSFKNFYNIDVCLDNGGAWNDKKQICDINIEREISNHIWTNNIDGLKINIPETDAVAILNDVVTFDNADYFTANYSSKHSSTLIEKGSVFYDSRKIILISKVETDTSTRLSYAAPFTVSNQGSGLFTYIGLFIYDKALQKSTHLDSYFLGDRVKDVKISDEIQAIKVSFFQHTITQAFSEHPTERQTIHLSVAGKQKKFQFYKSIHPDWDKDQDGINDCENDGSCDHTTDYTQGKMPY